MRSLRQRICTLAKLLQALRRLRDRRLRPYGVGLRFVGQHLLRAQLLGNIFDFVLAREHAILLGIGCVKPHA